MSARDDDADRDQGFLGRWIKRKSEARAREPDDAAQPPAAEKAAGLSGEPQDDANPEEQPFDLSTLPGLDEITAETSLSDFMRKEVPAALRNAALRRAWEIDPAIRDYVNPAREYAFDWNAPGGVPGNGPLEAGYDAMKQVAKAFSKTDEDYTFGVGRTTVEISPLAQSPAPEQAEDATAVRMFDVKNSQEISDIKTENISDKEESRVRAASAPELPQARRRHGGAAPV